MKDVALTMSGAALGGVIVAVAIWAYVAKTWPRF